MNHKFTLVVFLFCGTLRAMELYPVKDSKKEVDISNFESGKYDFDCALGAYYEDDEKWSKMQFNSSKNQTESSIIKPYIPEETEASSSCCSLLMFFLNLWNYSHAYIYPLSSSPK